MGQRLAKRVKEIEEETGESARKKSSLDGLLVGKAVRDADEEFEAKYGKYYYGFLILCGLAFLVILLYAVFFV